MYRRQKIVRYFSVKYFFFNFHITREMFEGTFSIQEAKDAVEFTGQLFLMDRDPSRVGSLTRLRVYSVATWPNFLPADIRLPCKII